MASKFTSSCFFVVEVNVYKARMRILIGGLVEISSFDRLAASLKTSVLFWSSATAAYTIRILLSFNSPFYWLVSEPPPSLLSIRIIYHDHSFDSSSFLVAVCFHATDR